MKLSRGAIIDSPILNRELRTLLRANRSFLWMVFFLAILLVTFAIAWADLDFRNRDEASRKLFRTIAISQALLFSFLAPILTAGSISGEHEKRTFLTLATTPLSGYHVALAKCFSALCYVLLLVVASIPVIAVTQMIGGVGWYEIVAAAIAILMTVLVAGMIGVACSAWTRRTYIALMLAYAVIVAEVFFIMAATGMVSAFVGLILGAFLRGRGGNDAVAYIGVALMYALIQGIVFVGLTHLARNGYLAGTRTPPQRSKRAIKSRVVIKQRQRRFPYYLIDPLKAPSPVPDGANAIYVRDKRHQPMGRLDFIIRISYVCLFISLFMGLAMLSHAYSYTVNTAMSDLFEPMLGASFLAVTIILLTAPLFASTAFSSEKEHGTFLSMMTTLITPEAIVWAKLRIILRYTLILLAALFGPAFVEMLVQDLSSPGGATVAFVTCLIWFLPFYLIVILGSALFGLLISARSKSMIRSMVVTYLGIIVCCVGPGVLNETIRSMWRQLTPTRRSAGWLDFFSPIMELFFFLSRLFGPIVSPYYFLAGEDDEALSATACFKEPSAIILYVGLSGVILVLLFAATLRALRRAVVFDTARPSST